MIGLLKRWWKGEATESAKSLKLGDDLFWLQDSACFDGADVASIRQRIEEARAWFRRYEEVSESIPIWAEGLRPAGAPHEAASVWLPDESESAGLASLVEEVCDKRKNSIPKVNAAARFDWPDALLVFQVDESLSCGVANLMSKLFNLDNLPAWETWLYFHAITNNKRQLLCFVPDQLMKKADDAVSMIPEGCAFWINPAMLFRDSETTG